MKGRLSTVEENFLFRISPVAPPANFLKSAARRTIAKCCPPALLAAGGSPWVIRESVTLRRQAAPPTARHLKKTGSRR